MGGVERVVLNLGKLLQSKGHQVSVVSVFRSSQEPFFNFENINIIYLSPPGTKCRNNLASKISTLFKLFLFYKISMKSLNTIFYISTFQVISIASVLVSRKIARRLIACEHSSYVAHGVIVRLMRAFTYRCAYKVITLTKSDQDKFLNIGIVADLIPNPLTEILSFRGENDLKVGRDFTCLSMGRLHKHKGFDRLIDVASNFKYEAIKFIIVGSGNEGPKLKRLIVTNGIEHKVFIKPASANISEVFSGADLFLMTSYTEAFPMVILECFQHGIPVIAYDCPVGPREIIKDGINGFLIPDGDSKKFEDKIRECIENPELLANLATSTKLSLEDFSNENIYSRWQSILSNDI
jgi:glycosyltransferase involved in cell wall biosynthesis